MRSETESESESEGDRPTADPAPPPGCVAWLRFEPDGRVVDALLEATGKPSALVVVCPEQPSIVPPHLRPGADAGTN